MGLYLDPINRVKVRYAAWTRAKNMVRLEFIQWNLDNKYGN